MTEAQEEQPERNRKELGMIHFQMLYVWFGNIELEASGTEEAE